MTEPGQPEYRLECSRSILRQLEFWVQHAQRNGFGRAFVSSIDRIIHELTHRPLEWGDPNYRLHALGLLVCHGMTDMVQVYYGVDEQHKVVYVKEFRLMPSFDFGQDLP